MLLPLLLVRTKHKILSIIKKGLPAAFEQRSEKAMSSLGNGKLEYNKHDLLYCNAVPDYRGSCTSVFIEGSH